MPAPLQPPRPRWPRVAARRQLSSGQTVICPPAPVRHADGAGRSPPHLLAGRVPIWQVGRRTFVGQGRGVVAPSHGRASSHDSSSALRSASGPDDAQSAQRERPRQRRPAPRHATARAPAAPAPRRPRRASPPPGPPPPGLGGARLARRARRRRARAPAPSRARPAVRRPGATSRRPAPVRGRARQLAAAAGQRRPLQAGRSRRGPRPADGGLVLPLAAPSDLGRRARSTCRQAPAQVRFAPARRCPGIPRVRLRSAPAKRCSAR